MASIAGWLFSGLMKMSQHQVYGPFEVDLIPSNDSEFDATGFVVRHPTHGTYRVHVTKESND